jgi:hypothetical protein
MQYSFFYLFEIYSKFINVRVKQIIKFKHEKKYSPGYFNLIFSIYVERFVIVIFIKHTPTEMGPFVDKHPACGREIFSLLSS